MTKNSDSGFSPNSESQGVGSVDPFLIISEPPDLKNWFSSYEYRSPELNTADGLESWNSMIVDDSEEDEEVSFVEDSINVKGEDLGVFGEHKCSEDEWKSSEEVEGNDFSEEGSYVDDSFKVKDENLRVFEDHLRRDECNEGETCVEDSIKVEGENLGEIGGLDSIDFVGCGGYKRDDCSEEETYVEDSIKQKDEKSRVFREIGNVDTFVQEKVGSEGYVGCENNIDIDDANQVADMSDTLNFSSEPPDIKNWFSSYTYESPALDTSDEFRLSSYKKGKTKQAGLHFGMSLKSEEENGIGTTTTPYNEASIGKQMDSAGSVKTTSSVEEKRQDHKNWGINSCSTINPPFKAISQQILKSNSASDSEAVSIEDVEFSDPNTREIPKTRKRKFPQNDFQKPFGALNSSGNEESSPRKSLNRSIYVQEDSGGRSQSDKDMFVSPKSNLDFIASRRSSSRTDMSNNKENDRASCAASGFILARKNRSSRENDENSLIRPPTANSQSVKNGVKVSSAGNKAEYLNRRALTDTTNTQPSEVLGVTGKWKCPQKSKPNLGPPMKQLGLERWVRRL
ncbi:hypothetical protein ACET3Z_000143 [Daucus carota]